MADDLFKELFDAHYLEIVRYLAGLINETAAAEDLAQEVFLKLYFQSPNDLQNPRAWLYRVATNTGYNYLRRENNRIKQEGILMQNISAIAMEDQAAITAENLAIQASLAQLSWRDRVCILMKIAGYSYTEISQAIGVQKSSVGTILVRAQEKFRRAYERREEC